MSTGDAKADLQRYLQRGRDVLVWKLEGLSEYDARRPLVPTGTNLLGLVKHVAGTEAAYLGATFARPFPEPIPWGAEDAEPNADMWALPNESREGIVDLYRRVWAHSDGTIATLDLETEGRVPWWRPEHATVTLHRVLIHMIAETDRHAGQADIVRELIDGAVGLQSGNDNLPGATRRGGRTTGAGCRRPPSRQQPLSGSHGPSPEPVRAIPDQDAEGLAINEAIRKWAFDRANGHRPSSRTRGGGSTTERNERHARRRIAAVACAR